LGQFDIQGIDHEEADPRFLELASRLRLDRNRFARLKPTRFFELAFL